jgi:membrane associated rhomboid family serine protease
MDDVEIFRSPWRAACEERGFVLHAVGIASLVTWDGRSWLLLVPAADAASAAAQIQRYEIENPPRRRFIRPEGTHGWAWAGAALFAFALLGIAYLAGSKAFGFDWFAAGVVDTAAVRSGEWWRVVTALTLHFDVGHLLANLGFGTVFVLLAGQLLGPGVAVLGVLLAAAGANLLNVFVQPSDHVSAGASTAVFATLGLLSAYAWRRRANDGERWAYRWAPLFAGVFLLAFTGVGDEHTDVLAHLTGFGMGAAAGAWLASRPQPFSRKLQWLAGLVCIAAVVLAWSWGLASGLGQ